MSKTYKILIEKYQQVLEGVQKPVIDSGDTKQWFQNGKRHRLDGPAIEWPNGTKHWYQNGELHRLDGPAIEYANGDKEWYINGEEYSEKDFDKEIQRRNILKKASDETEKPI